MRCRRDLLRGGPAEYSPSSSDRGPEWSRALVLARVHSPLSRHRDGHLSHCARHSVDDDYLSHQALSVQLAGYVGRTLRSLRALSFSK